MRKSTEIKQYIQCNCGDNGHYIHIWIDDENGMCYDDERCIHIGFANYGKMSFFSELKEKIRRIYRFLINKDDLYYVGLIFKKEDIENLVSLLNDSLDEINKHENKS